MGIVKDFGNEIVKAVLNNYWSFNQNKLLQLLILLIIHIKNKAKEYNIIIIHSFSVQINYSREAHWIKSIFHISILASFIRSLFLGAPSFMIDGGLGGVLLRWDLGVTPPF